MDVGSNVCQYWPKGRECYQVASQVSGNDIETGGYDIETVYRPQPAAKIATSFTPRWTLRWTPSRSPQRAQILASNSSP